MMRRSHLFSSPKTLTRGTPTTTSFFATVTTATNNSIQQQRKLSSSTFASSCCSSSILFSQQRSFFSTSKTKFQQTTTNNMSSASFSSHLQPVITPERMEEIRHMLEGRDPRGTPPSKFGGFFDDPNDTPGSYIVSVRELENFVNELSSHRTAEELAELNEIDVQRQEEENQQDNNNDDDDDTISSTSTKASSKVKIIVENESNKTSTTTVTKEQQQQQEQDDVEERIPHASTRSEIVSDTLERKLLLAFSIFKLNFAVEPPGALEPTTRAVDPQMYMRCVAGGIGFQISRDILIHILRNEEPMHPEVIRYLVELSLVLNDNNTAGSSNNSTNNNIFPIALQFADGGGDVDSEVLTKMLNTPVVVNVEETEKETSSTSSNPMKSSSSSSVEEEEEVYSFSSTTSTQKLIEDPNEMFELRKNLCHTAILKATSDFIMKRCMIAVLEGEGEGDAVTSTFETLRDILPVLPKEKQRLMIRTLTDQAQVLFQQAHERREEAKDAHYEHVHDELEVGAEVFCQSGVAMLKALVATGCSNVIDPSGALHFEVSCHLFWALRSLDKMIECCGVAEDVMLFYEEKKESLKLESERRKILLKEYGIDLLEEGEKEEGEGKRERDDEQEHESPFDSAPEHVTKILPEQHQKRYSHHSPAEKEQQQEKRRKQKQEQKQQEQKQDQKHQEQEEDDEIQLFEEKNTTDDDSLKNEFEADFRKVFFQYLSDRARTDPESGFFNILDACSRFPRSSEIFRLLTLCLFRLERYSEALTAIDRSIILNPTNPHCHKLRAHVLYRLGEYLTAERESYLAEALHDCFDGIRPQLTAADILHATGPLLIDADIKRQQLRDHLHQHYNGDPDQKPKMPDDLQTALQLIELVDPRTELVLSNESSKLMSELVAIQLPDTEAEMKHYLGQMRRHHMYTKPGGPKKYDRPVATHDLYDLIHEEFADKTKTLTTLKEHQKTFNNN